MSITTLPPFMVSVAGRTITPTGTVYIGGIRPRQSSAGAAVTLTSGVDGTVYDIYAQVAVSGQYTLIALATGTSVAGRVDVTLVGQAIDYPTTTTCSFLPTRGRLLDAFTVILDDGTTVLISAKEMLTILAGNNSGIPHRAFLGAATNGDIKIQTYSRNNAHGNIGINADLGNVNIVVIGGMTTGGKVNGVFSVSATGGINLTTPTTNAQILLTDTSGHLVFDQAASPSAAIGAGGGTGGVVTLTGGDQTGSITVVTGTTPAGANATVATITFVLPFSNPPHGIILSPANAAAHNLTRDKDVAVYRSTMLIGSWVVSSGATALAASTAYIWNYFVMGR